MNILSITLVLYHNDLSTITKTIKSCLQDVSSEHIYVVDNSKDLKLKKIKSLFGVNYLKNKNKGFGAGHNIAFKKFNLLKHYKYNLILNPDVTFEKNTLKKLTAFLDKNPEIGALMPKVVNLDESLQFARRCLPTPLHLIYKRIFPNSKISHEYELKNFEPNIPIELIGICGCFMLLRLKVIEKTKLFDERFFMYFEDFDLARRISLKSKVIYYPLERVFHKSERGHRKNLKLLYFLINSAIKYFIKWGFHDDYRNKTNEKLLKEIKKKSFEIC